MKINPIGHLVKTNPIQTQTKPISKEKMLLRLTINGRRKSFGYYADEIEAAKAYDRAAKKYRRCFYGILVRKASFARFIIDALLKKRILGLFFGRPVRNKKIYALYRLEVYYVFEPSPFS